MSDYHTTDDEETPARTENDDNRRPPGGGGVGAPVEDERDDPAMPSDAQPNYVLQARKAAGDLARSFELDPDKPWQTKDHDARLARAKEQAKANRVVPNYGTAGSV